MNRLIKTTAVLSGAVAVSWGAYALGTQAGDGSAQATAGSGSTGRPSSSPVALAAQRGGPGGPGGPRMGPGGPMGPDLAAFATKLGVDEAKLRQALQELRGDRADHRGEEAKALADALGISQDKVQQAFQQVFKDRAGDRRGEFAAALAKALGKSTADVQKALDAARRDPSANPGPPDRSAFLSKLASELRVSQSDLKTALAKVVPRRWGHGGPGRMGGRGPGGPGPMGGPGDHDGDRGAALAKALGVTTDQLQAAMKKLADQRRDDFATQLAAKLGIDKQKVLDALPARPAGHP